MDRKGVLSLPVQTSVITTSSCLAVGGDLGIKVPCAVYNSTRYGFILDFYRNPDDPSGLYWKLVMATLTAGNGTDCLHIGSDLSMPVSCVEYAGNIGVVQQGQNLSFSLKAGDNLLGIHTGLDDFKRHATFDRLLLFRQVDQTHTAFAD